MAERVQRAEEPQSGASGAPRRAWAQRQLPPWQREPAWHRRERRERQKARVLLALGQAAGLLGAHHSAPARRADAAADKHTAELDALREQLVASRAEAETLQRRAASLEARLRDALLEAALQREKKVARDDLLEAATEELANGLAKEELREREKLRRKPLDLDPEDDLATEELGPRDKAGEGKAKSKEKEREELANDLTEEPKKGPHDKGKAGTSKTKSKDKEEELSEKKLKECITEWYVLHAPGLLEELPGLFAACKILPGGLQNLHKQVLNNYAD